MNEPTEPTTKKFRLWRDELQDPLAPERKPPRTQRIFIVIAVMLGLIGALVGMLFWLRPAPRPLFIPLSVARYDAVQIPATPFAQQDRQALGKLLIHKLEFGSEKGGSPQRHHVFAALRELEDETQPVVVFLSAQAIRDAYEEIQVLPADAQPDNPATFIPLADVLAALKKCPSTNKLLILDLAHQSPGPRLGSPSSDVAEAIPAAVEKVDDPDLLVLTACAPGQIAHHSEALGRSVFAYYLEQGLRGWADGFIESRWHDGRISVKELAAYVQEKVDRWAQLNLSARQTPILLGKGKNFLLRAYADSDHQEPVPVPPMPEYPKWLQENWETAQVTYSSGNFRLTPYLFRHQTALLVQAEQLWRGGAGPTQIQDQEMAAFAQVQQLLPKKRGFDQPLPHSLALKLPGKTPAGLAKDLDSLLREWKKAGDEGKPEQIKDTRDKLLAAYLLKQKDRDPTALAQAVFSRAAELENPSREDILFLDGLIQAPGTDKKPQFLETLLLRHLAKLAATKKAAWPTESVALLLQTTALGEQAAGSLRAFAWNQELLETAAQFRHDGDIRLWGKDYASLESADQNFGQAVTAYQAVLSNTAAVELASVTVDEAMFFLPAYLPYLESHPENESAWMEAAQATALVSQALLQRTAVPAEVSARLKELGPHVATVRQKLDQLRQPFTPAEVKHLIAVSQDPRAEPVVRNEINALLTTPLLAPTDRASLWKAEQELGRRLQQKTLAQDDEDNRAHQTAGQLLPFDQDKAIARTTAQGLRQAQTMIALLRLGGLNEDSLARLDKAYTATAKGQGTPGNAHKLGALIQHAWVKELREQYQDEKSAALRDRLIRQFPPLDGPPGLQADQPADAALVMFEDGKELWSWLARQHQYQARDYQGSGLESETALALSEFHAKAAAAYGQLAPPDAEQYVQMKAGTDMPLLTPQRPTVNGELAVKVVGAKKSAAGPLPLNLLAPGKDWLQISPQTLLLQKLSPDPAGGPGAAGEVAFQVKLLDTAALSSRPAPSGFLAEALLGKKSFHRAVKVSLRAVTGQLQIILSPNPKLPDPPLDTVRLRPGKVRQKFFIHVYNPGAEPRKVIVQLLQNGEALKDGAAVVVLGPKESKPIPLGPGAPLPAKETPPPAKETVVPVKTALPPFTGNLQIRVLDGDDKDLVLATRPVEVAIANPREYVTVSNVKFDPAAPRNLGVNQLSVTLEPLATLAGPDIPAELVLPPSRIPALLFAKDGMFKGLLPAIAEPPAKLTLFAKDIKLSEEGEPEGYFYVDVDGFPRCFVYRTTFARQGDPLTPKVYLQPDVRFSTKAGFVQANAKFAVAVEVNNPPDHASLQVTLGREEAGMFLADVKQTFATPKDRQIGFALDGGLLFEANVADWLVPLDTSKIRGKRTIKATLRDEFGKTIAYSEQVLVIDDTPPDRVQFVKVPAKAQKGTKLVVRAAGTDAESGIQEAVFFVGTLDNGKIPPKTPLTHGKLIGKNGTTWEAELPLPDVKGPTDITVVMTNKVGLSNYDTTKVLLMDTDPVTTGPGSIKGKVMFGELPQQELPVYLYDDKGKVLDKATTNKEGAFVFANLKPGNYILYSLNKGSKRDGSQTAAVVANKVTEVTIKMVLK